ncbi:MAG TPA: hypothetical protein PLZ51_02090 [Aggregatilineales bacterium]|nr:hypothetical protein [Aggregatilineales bacterium]
MNMLQQGMIFGDYELISPLKKAYSIMPTWMAKKTDNSRFVLRFLSSMSMTSAPKTSLEPIQALPPIEGLIRWSEWQMVNLTDKIKALMIVRPYFSGRLIDHFPPDPHHPPHPSLLEMMSHVAKLFDTLEMHYPELNFELSPGNLLLDGDKPVLVDCGLAQYAHYHDMDMRSPFSTYIDPERSMPLSATYPSMWKLWAGTKSDYHLKIKRTDAQFALGALYVYLRTRFLLFEDPNVTPPDFMATASKESFAPKILWYLELSNTVQAYEEQGIIHLDMILEEREKNILKRALARDRSMAFSSCEAFIEALARPII